MKKCIYVGIFYVLSISITQQNYAQSPFDEVIKFDQCLNEELQRCVDAGRQPLERCSDSFIIKMNCFFTAYKKWLKASKDDRENTVTDQVENNSESINSK